jgi:hypothetical protein
MKPALLVVLFVVGVSALPVIVPINPPNSLPGSSLVSTLISSEVCPEDFLKIIYKFTFRK